MPTPRTEVTSAVIGNDVYVIGGAQEGPVASSKVEIFNMDNRSWRNSPSLPVPLHHTVAVTLQGKIYVLGGYLDGWISVNTTYVYDPADGQWQEGPEMPRTKAAFTAQVIDNRIYTIGGAATRMVGGRLIQEALNINEYYDTATGVWTTASPPPTPREHLASGQSQGKIYVVGGRLLTLATNSNINEEYDPKTDTWQQRAPMPTRRGGIAASSFGTRIFVFGGEANTGTYDTTEMFDPATNTWTEIDPMPTARHGLTAAAVRGGILVVGGGPQPGFTYTGANELLDPILEAETPKITTTSTDTGLDLNNIALLIILGAGAIVLMVASILVQKKRQRTG